MNLFQENNNGGLLKSFVHDKLHYPNLHTDVNKSCFNLDTQRAKNYEAMKESPRAGPMVTAIKGFRFAQTWYGACLKKIKS